MRSASTCRNGLARSMCRRSNTACGICHPAVLPCRQSIVQGLSMRKLLALLAVCVGALPLAAATPDQLKADYELLQKWQYGAPVPLAQPVTITRETAVFKIGRASCR